MELAGMANLNLTLLGGFEVRRATGEVVEILGQKDRALLAFLAVASGDAHPRERLAGMLWSEHGDRQARDSLKQVLVRLRRCLGTADHAVLRTDRQSIGLDRDQVRVDALAFERLVRDDTIDSLVQATSLYRGDLLEGIAVHDPAFEDWLIVERQRLRHLLERALTSLMSQALAAGEADTAAEAARRSILLDPLREAAHRTLMQVCADQGQTAQALKLYEALSERLHRELGVQPEPLTVALHDRIRQRRATTAPASGEPVPAPPIQRDASSQEDKPSVAILSFVNMSGDPEQEYFSEGITEDVITELSRFRDLFVIARNSSFQQRDKPIDVKRIGCELGVQFVVVGSVRKFDSRVRINAQLIDVATGNHLWAERYDRDMADVLALQEELAHAIAATVGGRVEAAGRDRATRLSPARLTAYDLVLRAKALHLKYTKADMDRARALFLQAIETDPTNARAHAYYANCCFIIWAAQWTAKREPLFEDFIRHAKRAVALDDSDSSARWILGLAQLYKREYEDARVHFEKAVENNPNFTEARIFYGFFLTAIGQPDAAIEQVDLARRHNPFDLSWVPWVQGITLFTARRYKEAIDVFNQIPEPINEIRGWLAASYARAGRLAEAERSLDEFLRVAKHDMAVYPGDRLEDWKQYWREAIEYRDQRDFDHLLDALRAAGLR
jgi:TolB-like protein/DNA-binding SARP family transcriptional activator